MAVTLMSPVEGKAAGESYSGPNEKFLVENGYARYNDKRRKLDLDKPSGVGYEYSDSEESEFVPTPTERNPMPAPAPETAVQTSPSEETPQGSEPAKASDEE